MHTFSTMIIDGAITLRELKEAVDDAIKAHGDHLPVSVESQAWATGVQVVVHESGHVVNLMIKVS